ncbi:MAG: LUD domain-containing protein [Thaumarchaeota archaeon]|nr:LUD domain-containing protein [Nitrososphaerota archaeon]
MSAVESFAQALKGLNAEMSFAATKEETVAIVTGAVNRSRASSVVVAGLPGPVRSLVLSALDGVKVVDAERLSGEDAKEAVSGADIGVTWAANGLVKEGALLEVTWDDAIKLASSLPMMHVALLSEKGLLPDLAAGMLEAGRIVSSSPNPKPIVSFIAGPSKTADIESRLLYGVHGPHTMLVIVLGWI